MKLILPPTGDEWLLFALIFLALGCFVGAAELIRKKMHWSAEVTRKTVHIAVGVLIYFAPQLFTSGIPAILLALVFSIVNMLAISLGLLKGMHGTNRRSYGTVYYPFSFFILVMLFWNTHAAIISIAILILALGDAAAAIVGEDLEHPHTYRLTSDKKSIEGSATMFVVTFLVTILGLHFHPFARVDNLLLVVETALATALFVTAWEGIASQGFDNLTVPLSAAFVLHFMLVGGAGRVPADLLLALTLGIGIGIAAYYFRFLSLSGSVATALLATIVYGIGGWPWTTPILAFFIVSSVLSKFGKARKKRFDLMFEKTDRRDAGQVAANGAVPGLLILAWYCFPQWSFWYPSYLAAIAAATADTWGTEIGILAKGNPRSILTLKHVETGTSGGVSLPGFIGGAAGALFIATAGFISMGLPLTATGLLRIVAAGVIGSLVDSALGATLQSQYRCTVCGKITERTQHCSQATTLFRGLKFIDNDVVNWCCAVAGAIAAVVF
ncbi:MAG: DUF92 domain-containing protein [Ignavibacteriales bacterium]|nr:DUF92 domain-containing protein [Ignavibacteriales bacterium]